MRKQIIIRAYNFTDAELYTWTLDRLRWAKRDQSLLTPLGFGPEQHRQLEKLCREFASISDDQEALGEQMTATQQKNQAREELLAQIRRIMSLVAKKYSTKEGKYRKFGTEKISRMSDPQLLFCGLRVLRVGRKLYDFIAETGLSHEDLNLLNQRVIQFEQALQIQQDRIADRDIAVEDRVIIGNALYHELVRLCDLGKMIWADDPAKHDQYCLYESNTEQKRQQRARKKEQNPENKKENLHKAKIDRKARQSKAQETDPDPS